MEAYILPQNLINQILCNVTNLMTFLTYDVSAYTT